MNFKIIKIIKLNDYLTLDESKVIYNNDSSFSHVQINDNIFEEDTNYKKAIKTELKKNVGKCFKLIESGQNIFIDKKTINEYTFSKYTKGLNIEKNYIKGNIVTGLNDLINYATDKKFSNIKKQKHINDAAYGFYKYKVYFTMKIKDKEELFSAILLIRNAINGKKYLYDILNIKQIKRHVPTNCPEAKAWGKSDSPTYQFTN